jgi:hypothetical protein
MHPDHIPQEHRRIKRLATRANLTIASVLLGLLGLLYPSWGHTASSCESQYRFCFKNELTLAQLQKGNPSLWSDIQRVKAQIAKGKSAGESAQIAADVLVDVKAKLGAAASQPPTLKAVIDGLGKDLDLAIQWYRLAAIGAAPDDKTAVALERWKLEPGSTSPGGAPEQWLKSVGCWAVSPSDACTSNYSAAVELGGRIFTVVTIIDEFNSPQRAENLRKLQDLSAQWEAYLYETQFQYVWELMFNRWLDNKLREIPKDPFGNEIGLRIPPSNRAIALHPDVGLQFIRGQQNGDRVVAAMTFEWVGYLEWTYKENRVDGLKGVSVVSTVADHQSAPVVGTGLMFHWDDYAFAFTMHGKNLAFTFNLKLGDKLSTVNDDWAKEIKKPLDKASKPQ